MKKSELIKKELKQPLTNYEELLLKRLDTLAEILCDIRNLMDNGQDR